MNAKRVNQIFKDTAYVRVGGTAEELKCAEYLVEQCAQFGGKARIEPFAVDMATIKEAVLTVDGKEIPCKGYFNSGSATVEAPFYYLANTDAYSLSQCKGKIVMIDGYLGYWRYQDMLANGAVGFITYDGNANYVDRDIDQRELRSFVSKGNKIPGVNINAKDAIAIVSQQAKMAKIHLVQDEYEGESRNVVLDIPGETDEYIVLTAHYDSVALSQGAYDNMSGSIGILALAEHFAKKNNHYGVRVIWCGSEERGLLGSKAYVKDHAQELDKIILNVNLDMIGSIMGHFDGVCTAEEKLCHYISYLGNEVGFGIATRQGVYSSDSTPFADSGIPAVSFARSAPSNTATIHNSYDTVAVMSDEQMVKDIEFICQFVERMVNAKICPVKKEMPENMKEKLDEYLMRKRPKEM